MTVCRKKCTSATVELAGGGHAAPWGLADLKGKVHGPDTAYSGEAVAEVTMATLGQAVTVILLKWHQTLLRCHFLQNELPLYATFNYIHAIKISIDYISSVLSQENQFRDLNN